MFTVSLLVAALLSAPRPALAEYQADGCNTGGLNSALFEAACRNIICSQPFMLADVAAYRTQVKDAVRQFCEAGPVGLACGPCTQLFSTPPATCCQADDPAACFASFQKGLTCASDLILKEEEILKKSKGDTSGSGEGRRPSAWAGVTVALLGSAAVAVAAM